MKYVLIAELLPRMGLKKISMIIISLLFFISCAQNNNNTPVIEIINQKVYFVDTKKNDKIYSRYDNPDQREKATNLITYKIFNPTNKKLLFCINKDEFDFALSGYSQKTLLPHVYFMIKDSVSALKGYMPLIHPTEDEEEMFLLSFDRYLHIDSIRKVKYKMLDVEPNFAMLVDDFIKNAVIINPNETKTFNILLSLPIVKEKDYIIGNSLFYIPNLTEDCKFQIYYSADSNHIKEALPEFLLKELEENQIEIFDGVLMSNEVPLAKRS